MTDPLMPSPTARVQRVLPAPPGVVYDEWLDPDALTEWMCPRPARCLRVEMEPWTGGSLRLDIEDGAPSSQWSASSRCWTGRDG